MHNLAGIAAYVDEPDVVQALVDSYKYAMSSGLKVAPTNYEHILKKGSADDASKVARVLDDVDRLKLLAEKERRKSVREAILRNPLVTEEIRYIMADRSVTVDKGHGSDIQESAMRTLSPEMLLRLHEKHRRPSGRHNDGYEVYVPTIDAEALPRAIPKGGPDFVSKLTELGLATCLLNVNSASEWYKPGLFAEIVGSLPQEIAFELFHRLYRLYGAGVGINADDVKAASGLHDVVACTSRGAFRVMRNSHPLDPDAARELLKLSEKHTIFRSYLERENTLPTDVLTNLVGRADSDHLETMLQSVSTGWTAELVNEVAYRMDVAQPASMFLPLLVTTKLPYEEYKKLSARAVFLCEQSRAYNRYRPMHYRLQLANAERNPMHDWFTGVIGAEKDVEEIRSLMARCLNVTDGSPIGSPTGAINALIGEVPNLEDDRLLVTIMETAGSIGFTDTAAIASTFKFYFGNDGEAWALAVDTGREWDSSVSELCETVCALQGLDVPDPYAKPETDGFEEFADEDDKSEPVALTLF